MMSDDTPTPATADDFNPYNPDLYRQDAVFIPADVKKAIYRITVDKPGKFVFFRIHPDPKFQLTMGIVSYMRDNYAVAKPMEFHPAIQRFMKIKKLLFGITVDGNPFLWPIAPQTVMRENTWSTTALAIAGEAQTGWRAYCTEDGFDGYKGYAPEDPGKFPDPIWPELTVEELLKLAFPGDRMILNLDHPIIKARRGA